MAVQAPRSGLQISYGGTVASGAVPIDHVLGLARSFGLSKRMACLAPMSAYPLEDFLGLVALESLRNRSLVVGEDLGTVLDAPRAALSERALPGCRFLYFERGGDNASLTASTCLRKCIASIGIHDVPALSGFWEGRDHRLTPEA